MRSAHSPAACGPRFRSQLYCAGYHQGAVLGAGGRDGCTSVVEAERRRIAQRGFADPRADRDVAARLSEGPVPAAQRCGEIQRAAPSGVSGMLSRRHRRAGTSSILGWSRFPGLKRRAHVKDRPVIFVFDSQFARFVLRIHVDAEILVQQSEMEVLQKLPLDTCIHCDYVA